MSISIPHCGPRGHPSREPIIKMIDPSGKWEEVTTKDITFEDIRVNIWIYDQAVL